MYSRERVPSRVRPTAENGAGAVPALSRAFLQADSPSLGLTLTKGALYAFILAGMFAAGAAAETTTTPEVLVTAGRVAVPSAQAGSSATIVTAAELQDREAVLVSDVLREIPGVSVNRAGGTGSLTQVRLRGAEANHTLVLIDGVEANDPAFGSEFDFAHLLAGDVERIEVLRGNQSALWGSDAIGGVISITTKRGKKGLRLTGQAEGGSFDTRGAGGTASGGGEKYDFAVSGNYLRVGGTNITRESIVRDVQQGMEAEDGYNNLTLSGSAHLRPIEALELGITARLVNSRKESDPQDFSTSGFPLFTPSPTQGFAIDGNDFTDSDQHFGRAHAKLTLFDGVWEQIVSGAVTDTDNDFFTNAIQTTGTAARKYKLDYQTSLFLDTPDIASAEHTLTFAAEREREDFQQRGVPSVFGNPNQDQTTINRAAVGEYRVGLWDRVFLSGSIRRDFNDRFADATTHRATAAYLHKETNTRLHGSYGTGIKNPTFTELFGFFAGTFVANPNLLPEESTGWDAGVEQSFFDGKLVVDVTHFRQQLENEITTLFPPPTFIATPVNVSGLSKRRGVEVSAKAKVIKNLDVTGSYTFTRATAPDATLTPKIRLEVRRPRHIAAINATWRFNDGKGKVNLGVNYNGPVEDLEFNGNTARNRLKLKGYALVNMALSYKLHEYIEVFGRVENLLNQDFEDVYSFSTPGIGGFGGIRVSLDAIDAFKKLGR